MDVDVYYSSRYSHGSILQIPSFLLVRAENSESYAFGHDMMETMGMIMAIGMGKDKGIKGWDG